MARVVGRYLLFDRIASGGMATIHLGCLLGPLGFSRNVAIKELHADQAADPNILAMFLDEASLASRLQHPNAVPVLDIIDEDGRVLLVMEYVLGVSLAKLISTSAKQGMPIPPSIATAIMIDALRGLHAAHELKGDGGASAELVHRDVSPHNILIGVDGSARVTDFGIAKARNRLQSTEGSELKGKASYMAPEQLSEKEVDRRLDVWAAGVTIWETLVGRSLFGGDSVAATFRKVLEAPIALPSQVKPSLKVFDACLTRALTRDPAGRQPTAEALAGDLRRACIPANQKDVASFIRTVAGPEIEKFEAKIRAMEVEAKARLSSAQVRPKVDERRIDVGSPAAALQTNAYEQAATGPIRARTALDQSEGQATAGFASVPHASPSGNVLLGEHHATTGSFQSGQSITVLTRKNNTPWLLLVGLGSVIAVLVFVVGGLLLLRREPTGSQEDRKGALAGKGNSVHSATTSASIAPSASVGAPATQGSTLVSTSSPTSTAVGPAVGLAVSPATAPVATSGTASFTPPHTPSAKPGKPFAVVPQQPPAAKRGNCDPPYTLGPPPDFIKKPKLECL
jgi:eukaryotic-like serine/threonine-protein kinase